MLNLQAFGATEYMDGALTFQVLCELFLRGRPSRDRGRAARPRGVEWDAAERRKECKAIKAVDFCGCVSSVFLNSMEEFTRTYLCSNDDGLPLTFPGLQRLGLRGVRSIPASVLTPFVMAFPSLTHLDLSGTLCSPDLVYQLAAAPMVRLTSLALARCARLTGESIAFLLTQGPATFHLEELSLYGDAAFSSPLTEADLHGIVLNAPCFVSGKLRYLDLSSCPVTPEILNAVPPQPSLRSLGLAFIQNLSLSHIATFMLTRAQNVEVLTLVDTSPELNQTPGRAALALHSQIIQPLATSPRSFSLTASMPPVPPYTRLRVIELSKPLLSSLSSGAGVWRIVRSKGGRGWYVDTASGWVTEGSGPAVLRRDLDPEHPFREELVRLADSNGNVSSGVGWHARKMEVSFIYYVCGGHVLISNDMGNCRCCMGMAC